MKNAPVLSQSDANNFFIFIIILITQGRREVKCLIRAKEGNNVYGFELFCSWKLPKKKHLENCWFDLTEDAMEFSG